MCVCTSTCIPKLWHHKLISYLIINLQICLFGFDRFSLVTFLENNQTALKHLFLKDYQNGQKGVVVYTREQLYENLRYAHEQVWYSCNNNLYMQTFQHAHWLRTRQLIPNSAESWNWVLRTKTPNKAQIRTCLKVWKFWASQKGCDESIEKQLHI